MENLITQLLIIIIGAFSKSLFDKILKDYNPDLSKIKKIIIYLMLFLLRYIFPLYFIIDLYLKTILIDKLFVMKFVVVSSVLFFNITIDIFNYFFNRILGMIEKHTELIREIVQLIKDSNNLKSLDKSNLTNNLIKLEEQFKNIEVQLKKQLKNKSKTI